MINLSGPFFAMNPGNERIITFVVLVDPSTCLLGVVWQQR